MVNLILENLELLFGGIGIFITVYIIKFFIWLKNRNKNKEQINNIVRKYMDIIEHRIPGHSGIRGLIEAGAGQLSRNKDLIIVCEKISLYGKPNPLNYWLTNNIREKEFLKFIKWQAQNKVIISDYNNEQNFQRVLERYKNK